MFFKKLRKHRRFTVEDKGGWTIGKILCSVVAQLHQNIFPVEALTAQVKLRNAS